MKLWNFLQQLLPSKPAPRFHGGLHIPSHKALSANKPSVTLPLQPHYYLSLRARDGEAFVVQVAVGERVKRGQVLLRPSNRADVPVHAPTSGVITAICEHPDMHPSNQSALCLVLSSDGADESMPATPVEDYRTQTPQALCEQIFEAGIVGMGGAGFPTARKLSSHANTLIINAAECEPYITCDDRQIQEHAAAIVHGAQIAAHITGAQRILFGIEDDKPNAIAALQSALHAADDERIGLQVVPTVYPSGNARQLFELLLGIRVPPNAHATDYGLICHNTATMKALYDALVLGVPLTERYTTVSGEGVISPVVVRARLGTPLSALLAAAGGLQPQTSVRTIIGGPMMGFALHDLRAGLQKTGNCLLVLPEAPSADESACIRCAQCADHCPMELLPQQLLWYSRADDPKRLQDYRLFDCIECGLCAAVCPSHIPLVQYYRHSKAEIKQQQHKSRAQQHARQRHEARQARLERERLEREARMAAREQGLLNAERPTPPAPVVVRPPVAQESALPPMIQAFDPTQGQTASVAQQQAIAAAKARAAERAAARKAQSALSAETTHTEAAETVAQHNAEPLDKLAAAKARAAERAAARKAQSALSAETTHAEPAETVAQHNAEPLDKLAAAKARAAERAAARKAQSRNPPASS